MLPTIDALKAQWKGDRLMRKNSTVVKNGNRIFKQPALTIGLDFGDRRSCYCVLDELRNVILERSMATTSSGIRQAFGKMRRSRIALETGTHSPWVSRQLARMDHEVIALKVLRKTYRLLFQRLRFEGGKLSYGRYVCVLRLHSYHKHTRQKQTDYGKQALTDLSSSVVV
jgi:hypothetical protein